MASNSRRSSGPVPARRSCSSGSTGPPFRSSGDSVVRDIPDVARAKAVVNGGGIGLDPITAATRTLTFESAHGAARRRNMMRSRWAALGLVGGVVLALAIGVEAATLDPGKAAEALLEHLVAGRWS